ncbi:MAG: RES family NAD+ phosphorylase [Candidatus Margulisiibacteriota bacterium]
MKLCCKDCFSDAYLQAFLLKNGRKGACHYCKSKSQYCISTSDLIELFRPIINLYEPLQALISAKEYKKLVKKGEVSYLWDKLQHDWGIFNISRRKVRELLVSRLTPKDSRHLLRHHVELRGQYEADDEDSPKAKWLEFSEELKTRNRFFPGKEINLSQLESRLQFLERQIAIKTPLYRSRNSLLGEKYEPREMGKPPVKKTKSNRANPPGISYLYLANDTETALAETRPSLMDRVTIGKFLVVEEMELIDLRDISPFQFVIRVSPSQLAMDEDFEELVGHIDYLKMLGADLSKPVNPKEADLEYLPSQYLCEFIKNKGWDGVMYGSSLAEGYNIALFSDTKLKCVQTLLYEVNRTDFKYTLIT